MHKSYFLKILTLLFLPFQMFAYDFSFQKGDNLLQIDFEGNQVKEIKFDLTNDGKKFVCRSNIDYTVPNVSEFTRTAKFIRKI